eukprot:UN04359
MHSELSDVLSAKYIWFIEIKGLSAEIRRIWCMPLVEMKIFMKKITKKNYLRI